MEGRREERDLQTGWCPGTKGLRRAVSCTAAQGLKGDGIAELSVSPQPQPTECMRRQVMTAPIFVSR